MSIEISAQSAVESISEMILAYSSRLASEQSDPGFDCDRSETRIADYKEKIRTLRGMRNQLEETYTGAIV